MSSKDELVPSRSISPSDFLNDDFYTDDNHRDGVGVVNFMEGPGMSDIGDDLNLPSISHITSLSSSFNCFTGNGFDPFESIADTKPKRSNPGFSGFALIVVAPVGPEGGNL